ncbi:MAG: hypothetical protein KJ884_19605 [Gammaproteobacteria bacterium]|nr:hypothetical protein [Gammaproteobacteria bacterium]MBU1490214.1 hypothetical protein [Gammaproteobacteria bacterium]MBU2065136.1 hypothetical protein [Gammaproteobacteria bacterium]MBU2140126.1 hypothetical protein [Gammaproteobacteria bacterium]MBU2216243.1 hypothetical protein [Gammaproteobacteria bacterium]
MTTIEVQTGHGDEDRLTYEIAVGSRHYQVYFACARAPLRSGADAALALSALAAMDTGHDLHISGTLSPTFLQNQQQLMGIFCQWFDRYQSVEFQADALAEPIVLPAGRVGCFFTGGVDSFYSFLKHREHITDLIFVHGYDVGLKDWPRREAVSAMGRSIEAATGVRFIEVESNAIRLFRDFGRWGLHSHGYGLGTVARHLAGYLDRLYVPSSFAQADLSPWASHPLTDPLFSDEDLQVVHDGCEAGRVDKVVALSGSTLALQHLRVCWERVEGAYNCGVCEKCLRTMTSLYAVGVLEQSATFPQRLDAEQILTLVLYDESLKIFARENLRLLEQHGKLETPVGRAWQTLLARSHLHNRLRLRLAKWRKRWLRLARKLTGAA